MLVKKSLLSTLGTSFEFLSLKHAVYHINIVKLDVWTIQTFAT